MTVLTNVFGSDVFQVASLTSAIEKAPVVRSRLGELGLFNQVPISTSIAVLEWRNGKIGLVPTSPRGAPAPIREREVRQAHTAKVPHIQVEDCVLADDVLNVRAFGSSEGESGLDGVVGLKLIKMKQDIEATLEYLRAGAIQGLVTYPTGSTDAALNLYTLMGTTEVEVGFDFGVGEDILAQIMEMTDAVLENLGNAPLSGIRIMCGREFFRMLVSHASVLDAYRYQVSQFLRDDQRNGFAFGGNTTIPVFWEEYYNRIGAVTYFPADEARAVPMGSPGLFDVALAPADFVEAAGTLGQEIYSSPRLCRWVRGLLSMPSPTHCSTAPVPRHWLS